ncbi:MAG: hypothetical protein JRH13_03500 [Deltaproteobacteria bacterium]|nr:hypothetical protein [Deltaproteobacteria bacterium]MBW2015463.1 hypothetical protein [Deltaproteobacteria bacterium]MBW2128412.1 hypothetical protein [Deltaproteobacteria bacterium]MBW2304379.1 hypothetical protein [Deltaproteobacteria bacterium]
MNTRNKDIRKSHMASERKKKSDSPDPELSEEEKAHIREVFSERIVPKLRRLQARTGNLACDFAGEKYGRWTVRFVSRGTDFVITDFEFDEDARGVDLDF